MVKRATADPHIGERIRTRRKVRGWSIRYAADRAGLSHSTWSRIERGVMSADNRFVLADIAQALECSVLDLTGSPAAPDSRDETLLAVAVEALHTALVEADPAEDAVCTPRPFPELRDEADLVRHLRLRCDYIGTGQRLSALVRELHAATRSGAHRKEALTLLAGAAYDAATLMQTTGYRRDGWLAAQRCHQAAELLDDPVMLAYAEFTVSNAAASTGAYSRALARATRAVDDLTPHLDQDGALSMVGMLQLSCALASRGLRRTADSADCVTAAGEIADRLGDADDLGFGQLGFGPTNTAIWRVSIETDGGDPGKAVEIASSVNPRALPMPSRQSGFHADTARALTRLGRDREALRHLLVAERISPLQVRSNPLVRETVRGMLDRAGGGQLRGLCERMNLAAM